MIDPQVDIKGNDIFELSPELLTTLLKNITGKALSGHLRETDENGQVKVLATTKVIAPNEICTESYIAIGKFDTDIEANNAYKYLCTNFFRFLLQALPTLDIRKERFYICSNVGLLC